MDQWPQNVPYRSDPYGNGPINAPNLSRADSAWGPYGYRFFQYILHTNIHTYILHLV